MDTADTDDLSFNDTNVDPYTQYKYKIVTTTAKGSVYSFILQNYFIIKNKMLIFYSNNCFTYRRGLSYCKNYKYDFQKDFFQKNFQNYIITIKKHLKSTKLIAFSQ